MSYPQNRIFTPIRNQPLTGRNANIQPMMYKRKQIFEKVSVERFQTPFSGYSFTGSSISESNILARSQVSDFSQQNVIKLIKEQLQRNGLNNTSQTSQQNLKNKNELNILRIQVRSIKQSYHELNKSIKRKFDQQNQFISLLKKQLQGQAKSQSITRQQIFPIIDQKIKQLQVDMAGKTRQVFNKAQQEIRRQIMNYVNRQFVPRSFLDDFDKQFSQLDNRIQHLEGQYNSSNNKNIQNNQSVRLDKDTSLIIASGSELKLNKLQRDFQNMRKIIDQKSQKIKQLDQLIQMSRQNQLRQFKEIKQLIIQSNGQIKKQIKSMKEQLNNKIENQKRSFIQRIQTQIQSIMKKIENQNLIRSIAVQNMSGNFKSIPRLQSSTFTQEKIQINQISNEGNKKIQNLSESIISQGQSSTIISQFDKQSSARKNVKKITITFGAPVDKSKNQSLASSNVEQFNSENFIKQKQLNTSNITDNKNISLSGSQISQITQNQGQTSKPKKIYKVDRNGYLMDHENKYLLSSSNSMIKISQQQISSMQQTNLIKVQRWTESLKE